MSAKYRVSRFTDEGVRKLRPRKERFVLRGPGGLGLRVCPSGAKSWVYCFRFDGRSRMVTLGPCPPIMPADAREMHLQALGQRRQGIDPGAAGFAEMLKAIRAGAAYPNVHTTMHPGGEIRGRFHNHESDDH